MGTRSLAAALSLLLLIACAPPVPPATPPQAPPQYTSAAPPPPNVSTDDISARAARSAEDQKRQIDAQLEPVRKAAAEAVAKRDADRAAREEALKKQCDDTRPARAEHDKRMLIARMQTENRLLANAKAIQAACRLGTRKTGAMNVERTSGGWRVSPELAEDVQCSSLPKGITKDDAYIVLWRARDGSLKSSGPILESEDRAEGDSQCNALDLAVGLDPGGVTWGDSESITRFAKWKP